eukprot:1197792-Alexandrium_andersonii.AAC.1
MSFEKPAKSAATCRGMWPARLGTCMLRKKLSSRNLFARLPTRGSPRPGRSKTWIACAYSLG